MSFADQFPRDTGNQNRGKTHCVHGHEFNLENTQIRIKTGQRVCRACTRARSRVHWHLKGSAARRLRRNERKP